MDAVHGQTIFFLMVEVFLLTGNKFEGKEEDLNEDAGVPYASSSGFGWKRKE